jgi:hypothetical protein
MESIPNFMNSSFIFFSLVIYRDFRISPRLGILRKSWRCINFRRAKLTVLGARPTVLHISFGHIGPSFARLPSTIMALLGRPSTDKIDSPPYNSNLLFIQYKASVQRMKSNDSSDRQIRKKQLAKSIHLI